ncbi:MAG: glycoside hydrolase family 26 protein [Bacteroidaceae bacterium]|nr:glycoside hydrolase family 26 protein [Bacteroidaceae bacterium]
MKRLLIIPLFLSFCTLTGATRTTTLCNPNATEEAKSVFLVLNQLYGERTISATVADVNWNITEAENVNNWTGQWPAMNVFDFIHAYAAKDVNPNGWINYKDTSVPRSWWRAGGLVGAMWHWNVRTNDGTGWTCTPGTADGETSFDISKVSDTESDEYQQIIKDLDQVAGYLKLLQNYKIPVIWRPLHEAAGNTYEYSGGKAWFWWGAKGATPYKQLWQLMYDRFVNHHGLNNLIWVWTSQVGDNLWYPGDEYVDIIGRDNYGITATKAKTEFTKLQTAYPSKMVVLAECGHSSSKQMAQVPGMWDKGAKWGWFMTWYDHDYNTGKSETHRHTNAEWWQAAWDSGVVVDRAEMKQLRSEAVGVGEVKSERVKSERFKDVTFNIGGQRINGKTASKGIYVKNGKKILIK